MTRDERKRLLVIACACDRLQWSAAVAKKRHRPVLLAGLPAWAKLAAPLAMPFLPRRLRLIWSVVGRFL